MLLASGYMCQSSTIMFHLLVEINSSQTLNREDLLFSETLA